MLQAHPVPMSNPAIAEFVTLWSIVYVASLVTLAGLSWLLSVGALEGLAALDRWRYAAEHKCRIGSGQPTPEDEAAGLNGSVRGVLPRCPGAPGKEPPPRNAPA